MLSKIMWFNSLCATDFYAPAIRDCSVSVCSNPSGELEAKVILNRNFLFPLPLRITEARHAFRELEEALVLNNKREILRHVTHYLPTSTPTAADKPVAQINAGTKDMPACVQTACV